MMDERLYKIKELLQKIESGSFEKEEEKQIRFEIAELENQLNLLNKEKNLQS
jgi:hypothetical protein